MERMGAETVLLNVRTSKFCVLNRSAAVVWSYLGEARTLDAIAAALCNSFDGVSLPQASQDAREVLDQLCGKGFVVRMSEPD